MLRRHATVAILLLAQPARGVLLSLPSVVAAGFAPAELEEVPSSRDGASAPDFDEEFDEEEPDDVWEDRLERFVTRALNLTKGHGGECAVGTGCGAAAGWLLRKLQGAIVTATVLSSLGAAGARLLCTRCGPGLHPAYILCALSSSTSSAPAPRSLRTPRRARSLHLRHALSALLRPRRAYSLPPPLCPPCPRLTHMWAAGALHVGWMTSAQLQAACAPTCIRTTCSRHVTRSMYTARARACARSSRVPCLGSVPHVATLLRCTCTAHSAHGAGPAGTACTHTAGSEASVQALPARGLRLLRTLQAILGSIAQAATSQARAHAAAADLDGDGEITLEDSKLGMSRMAPYVRRHPGLTGGFAGGFLLAYRLV